MKTAHLRLLLVSRDRNDVTPPRRDARNLYTAKRDAKKMLCVRCTCGSEQNGVRVAVSEMAYHMYVINGTYSISLKMNNAGVVSA